MPSRQKREGWELQDHPRFEFRRKLGEGGFGAVFEVMDREQGARVALKMLRRVEPEDLYRFKQEFRGLADISHPNLAQLHELSVHRDKWFFTMELVDGTDVLSYVQQRPHDEALTPTMTIDEAPPAQRPVVVRTVGTSTVMRRAGFDEGRLRAVLLQLVEGLAALHDAGKMHRDIKPSNVLVTRDERLVLVDFGLVVRLSSSGELSRTDIVGTPAYLPPELLRGHPASAAGDWYAVGVLLYEALTGQLPFTGTVSDILQQKLVRDVPRPSSVATGVPPDLDRLCAALLCRRAEERPTQAELLDRLGSAGGPRSGAREIPFLGRVPERRALTALFDTLPQRGAAVALVDGPSGIGKSALLRKVAQELQRAAPGTVVLSGRCYEQESVPYKALDGFVDPLSRYLKQLAPGTLAAVLPEDVRTAARLFPVLEQVEAIAQAPARPIPAFDAQELRRRGLRALRDLLARLGRVRPLVLALDDLQWGDPDSGALLVELLAPPDPPPLLLLAAYRTEDAATSPCLQAALPALAAMRPALRVETVSLAAMPDAQVQALVRALLPDEASGDVELAREMAREAGGNPYFVRELCARVRGGAGGEPAPSLDAMVRARVAELPEGARRLLEVVALAGRPIERGAAARAAALEGDGPAAYGMLRSARLIRRREAALRDEIETYHDRIREAVEEALAPGPRRDVFRRLAAALDGTGQVDAETLAFYFLESGDRARAAALMSEAAAAAARSLAFDRAARLYRTTLDLGGEDDPARGALTEQLGDALAHAGRGAEAAAALQAASERAPADRAPALRRRAAEQLLAAGHVDEGMAALQDSVRGVGLHIPARRWQILAATLGRLLVLSVRGFGVRAGGGQASPAALRRIDTCSSAALMLLTVDTVLAAYFDLRGLTLALAAGEPRRVLGLLAFFVALVHAAGVRRLAGVARRAERAYEALGARLDQPGAELQRHLFACLVELGDDLVAAGARVKAAAILQQGDAGSAFGRNMLQEVTYQQRYWSGAWGELAAHLPGTLAEARARGNRHVARNLTLRFGHVPALCADDPAEGARVHAEARAGWWPARFGTLDHFSLLTTTDLLLYEEHGRGARAHDHIEGRWPALRRSQLLRLSVMALYQLNARARAALARAATRQRGWEAALEIADRAARELWAMESRLAKGLGALAGAGVAAGRGDAEGARGRFAQAAAALDDIGCAHYAAVARRRQGALTGGAAGEELTAEADARLRREGIASPARVAAMLAPGRWDGA